MNPKPFRRGRRDQGYILLILMLVVALLVIAAAAVAPSIMFEVKRDREEELIHRGVQYSRAVRKYVKKFGRYPTRIEELENTNNMRFLRKRYKDPVTGKEFRLLHMGEVQTTFAQGLVANALGSQAAAGVNPATGISPGLANFAARAAGGLPSGVTTAPNTNPLSPADPSQAEGEDTNNVPPAPGAGGINSSNLTGQVFGGGPIVGVASVSKDKTIREFNKKNHYNQWQFIYDPNTDRGGLLNTPAQPALTPMGQTSIPGATNPGNSQFGSGQFGGGQFSTPTPQQPPPAPPQSPPNQ